MEPKQKAAKASTFYLYGLKIPYSFYSLDSMNNFKNSVNKNIFFFIQFPNPRNQ